MRILFCCEFYAPSIGGVQEVIKQVAEHLVVRGHEVTVATRTYPSRTFNELNGVRIVEFEMSGNLAYGMTGEIENYQQFVISHKCDVLMIKAAQQCTFDALWPVLSKIKAQKVFVPCGFSGFYDPIFADYFRRMPEVLRQFNHLIYYASDYRDINFARKHGIQNFSIIPNGASEVEFATAADPLFRDRYGINKDDFIFLTVGSMTGAKGHFEVAKAFKKMKLKGKATLILNGNVPCYMVTEKETLPSSDIELGSTKVEALPDKDMEPVFYSKLRLSNQVTNASMLIKNIVHKSNKAIKEGTFMIKFLRILKALSIRFAYALGVINETKAETYISIADDVNASCQNKKVLITDFPRSELIQAFMAADLFVFASNIEYSPLVLFESVAAGTPFLSVPVGNAEEIANLTCAGKICPAPQDEIGYTMVDPSVLAKHMSNIMKYKAGLTKMSTIGKEKWAERFTWDKITIEYEKVFNYLIK